MVERVRAQMATWRMRVACWIPKATDTHSEPVIFIAYPPVTMFTRTPLNVTLYIHCLSCIGCPVLGIECPVLGIECPVPCIGCPVLGVGCPVQLCTTVGCYRIFAASQFENPEAWQTERERERGGGEVSDERTLLHF